MNRNKNSKIKMKNRMMRIKTKNSPMSLVNKLVVIFLKKVKINFHKLILKKILTFKKGFKKSMEKLNFSYLKLTSHKSKLNKCSKYLQNSLLMISNKSNWLIWPKINKLLQYSSNLLSTSFRIGKSLIFTYLFGSREISMKKII